MRVSKQLDKYSWLSRTPRRQSKAFGRFGFERAYRFQLSCTVWAGPRNIASGWRWCDVVGFVRAGASPAWENSLGAFCSWERCGWPDELV